MSAVLNYQPGSLGYSLVRRAGSMKSHGASEEAIVEVLLEENARAAHFQGTPLSEEEVRCIAREAPPAPKPVPPKPRPVRPVPTRAAPRTNVAPIEWATRPATKPKEKKAPTITITRMADVQSRDAEFLWEPYWPRGEMTIINGDPNEGKTTVQTDVAARVTTGAPMPLDDVERPPRNVLILNAEDSFDTTLRPKLEAAGADLNRVYAVDDVWGAGQIADLEKMLDQIGDVDLIIIDAIMSALGEVDAHRDNEVRSILLPLTNLAKARKLAISAGRHLHKGEKRKAMYAGGGSIGISALARSELIVGPNPDAPETEKLIAPVKWNLAPGRPSSMRFRIVGAPIAGLSRTQPRVEWLGKSALTAHDLVASDPGGQDKKSDERRRLGRFLYDYFGPERIEAKRVDVLAAAEAGGLPIDNQKAWDRAREDLGIVSLGRGLNATWRMSDGADSTDSRGPNGQQGVR